MRVTDRSLVSHWIDRLILEMLRYSLEDAANLPESHPLARYSAEFCLEHVVWSRYLQRVASHPLSDEEFEVVLGADFGDSEWRKEPGFRQLKCLHCGKSGLWRPILSTPHPDHPASWRYNRPENFVKLCRSCRIRFKGRLELLGEWVWGERFLAFREWHDQFRVHTDLTWDKEIYPLWPPEFGGMSWEDGSPAVVHSAPRVPERALLPLEERRRQIKRLLGHTISETLGGAQCLSSC